MVVGQRGSWLGVGELSWDIHPGVPVKIWGWEDEPPLLGDELSDIKYELIGETGEIFPDNIHDFTTELYCLLLELVTIGE